MSIYEQLPKVSAELGTIEKDTINAGRQSYQAFGVDTIYRHLRPLLAKHKVTVVPQIESVLYGDITASSGSHGVSAHVHGSWLFYAEDGTFVEMRFAAEGHDYQDKATNKAVQQAFKYGLIQMFQISTGEVDPDAAELPERVSEPIVRVDPNVALVKQAAWEASNHDTEWAKQLFQQAMEHHLLTVDEVPTADQANRIVEWIQRGGV